MQFVRKAYISKALEVSSPEKKIYRENNSYCKIFIKKFKNTFYYGIALGQMKQVRGDIRTLYFILLSSSIVTSNLFTYK